MPRSFWKGAISFGLVVIPVRMYVATDVKTPAFHYLLKKDLPRPKQMLVSPESGEQYTVKDTVRGYEYAKNKYVVLSEEDFARVPVPTQHTIDIQSFTDAENIDPIYFYDAHYLEPEEIGVKPYQLLREALLKTRQVGIAKVSFARREHLTCLRPYNGVLAIHTMHYTDEIHPYEAPAKPELTDTEINMAVSLIKAMERPFRPEDYHDSYRDALDKLIKAKLAGRVVEKPLEPKAETADLMAALRASLEATRKVPKAVAAKKLI